MTFDTSKIRMSQNQMFICVDILTLISISYRIHRQAFVITKIS